jgi:multimeric flavodoxin WrbA
MKIAVLNGSPKGDISVTMQYVKFIQKKFLKHELKILNISHGIKRIEKDENAFREIIEEVKASDGVLWAFPLYYLLVPSQYKRFIELISEKGVEESFKNKYTAVLTTSIHFFDHAAHNYMHAICDDLDMKYVDYFSADMDDLLKEKERKRLLLFVRSFFEAIEGNMATSKSYAALAFDNFTYIPGNGVGRIDTGNKKILIITDSIDNHTNLGRMIERFRNSFSGGTELVYLNELDIKGGCLGCVHCSFDNICVYQDGFSDFFNTRLKNADILVYGGAIKDRYLSSRWKMFFDREFFRGHTPTLTGKQVGFIISGPLKQIPNLRQVLEAQVQSGEANLVDFITDEYGDSAYIDALLEGLAGRLVWCANHNYIKPDTFLSVGGRKLFRDDIWGRLRFVFQADHRFYKSHGFYDFPQKDYKTRAFNLLMMLFTKIPAVRKGFHKKIKEQMVKPYKKILED